jgi:D-beta-D-heptose 7-phosphate kinase/D-beta-D-heptose 1-phosphate adenosyltransferase
MDKKVKSIADLARIAAALRARGKRIVFTNGCFDILHTGHVRYLRFAKAMGDCLVVAVNSDSSVRALKGKARPLNAQSDRAEVLAALSSVDYITIFNELTPLKIIRRIKPDILVKGGDWKVKDMVGSSFVRSYGGRTKSLPFVKGFSTTAIVKKIRSL